MEEGQNRNMARIGNEKRKEVEIGRNIGTGTIRLLGVIF